MQMETLAYALHLFQYILNQMRVCPDFSNDVIIYTCIVMGCDVKIQSLLLLK